MKLKVIVAGATGWVGKSLSTAIYSSADLELVAAIAPRHAGQNMNTIVEITDVDLIIARDVDDVLGKVQADIFIDFTKPHVVKNNVLKAVSHGLHVIVGTSGLTEADYEDIKRTAQHHNVGVIACGNFSLTAALLKHFATIAASVIPNWEIIDYASAHKPDAPSGTARELAESLAHARAGQRAAHPECFSKQSEEKCIEQVGVPAARGGEISGTHVHSVRLPGYTLATEIIFGLPHEKLKLYHEAGASPEPYIQGVLLATRRVASTVGLIRGLDVLLKL